MPAKLLIAGEARSDLQAQRLFQRADNVNKKHGPFDAFIIMQHQRQVPKLMQQLHFTTPVNTYLVTHNFNSTTPQRSDPQHPHHTCLCKRADMIQIGQVVIAYVAVPDPTPEDLEPLKARATEAGGVDLLITCAMPRGCHNKLTNTQLPNSEVQNMSSNGSHAIADLAVLLRPRYHFCSGGEHSWQRPPYSLPGRCGLDVCRVICLAHAQEDKNQKWLHALSLSSRMELRTSLPLAMPENVTECPYSCVTVTARKDGPKLNTCEAPDSPACQSSVNADGPHRPKRQRQEYAKDTRDWISKSCWFCMASPQFESHQVVSVGEDTYLACAKGPLNAHHVLIVPVVHRSSSLDLTPDERTEVRRFVNALRDCFAKRGKSIVVFERFVGRTHFEHMHLQVVPLDPVEAMRAREAFERAGAAHGMNFELLPPGVEVWRGLEKVEPFFAVELPSGETLVHRLRQNPRRHPLQFGREVLANIIGDTRLADWKQCLPKTVDGGPTLEQLEEKMRDDFQSIFVPFFNPMQADE